MDQWVECRKLVHQHKPEKLDEVRDLAVKLKELSIQRNMLVHYFWPWGTAKGNPDRIRLQSIKRRKGTHDVLEFCHLDIDVDSLDDLNSNLYRLYHRMMIASMQLTLGKDALPST